MIKRDTLKEYSKLNPPKSDFVFAEEFLPKPSDRDYKSGGIDRFFLKKINETSIVEVNIQNYGSTTPMLYEKISLWWRISGPISEVRSVNEKTIKKSQSMMPGISGKLINPLQFFKG